MEVRVVGVFGVIEIQVGSDSNGRGALVFQQDMCLRLDFRWSDGEVALLVKTKRVLLTEKGVRVVPFPVPCPWLLMAVRVEEVAGRGGY